MKHEDKKTSDLRLERYALGELPREEMPKLRESLESDEVLKERLSALESSNREILDEYPPERMAALIRDRLSDSARGAPRIGSRSSRFRPSPRVLAWSLGAAAALLISVSFFALRPGLIPDVFGSGGDTVRVKGGAPHLILFRKTKLGAEQLVDGSMAQESDVLQVGYEAGRPGYGAIFSVDGRGGVTFHLPPSYGGSRQIAPKLEAAGQALLPSAYELDDAPSFERFFFVYSPTAFDLSSAWRAARALAASPGQADRGALQLPAGLRWYSFLVRKKGIQ